MAREGGRGKKRAKLEIVSLRRAEEAQYLVCGDESVLPDDVQSCCSECGATVYHRPHAPAMPLRLCMQCAGLRMEDDDELTFQTTPQAMADVFKALEHLRKKRLN